MVKKTYHRKDRLSSLLTSGGNTTSVSGKSPWIAFYYKYCTKLASSSLFDSFLVACFTVLLLLYLFLVVFSHFPLACLHSWFHCTHWWQPAALQFSDIHAVGYFCVSNKNRCLRPTCYLSHMLSVLFLDFSLHFFWSIFELLPLSSPCAFVSLIFILPPWFPWSFHRACNAKKYNWMILNALLQSWRKI